jgi:hypothetical protein
LRADSDLSSDVSFAARALPPLRPPRLPSSTTAGATPFIPFKSSSRKDPKPGDAWARMYHYFAFHREEFLDRYHKRSNVESAFSMMKNNFGTAVRSKSDWGQVNEVLCKVLCHNVCVLVRAMHDLGIAPDF